MKKYNIFEVCKAISEAHEKAKLVDEVGGITTALAPSDKQGYLFKNYYVNEVLVKQEYIEDTQYVPSSGTYTNPTAWESGMAVVAYTNDDAFSGDGWYVFDGLVQRCIKSGNPTSFEDAEYWEIVG